LFSGHLVFYYTIAGLEGDRPDETGQSHGNQGPVYRSGRNIFPHRCISGPGYVWHCHILGHEDNEMMRPFLVTPLTAFPFFSLLNIQRLHDIQTGSRNSLRKTTLIII